MSNDSEHCAEDCTQFDWGEWAGVDGPVLICTQHGLLAPGSAYESEAGS